jgi:hypothetical protein
MAVIDIGPGAIERSAGYGGNKTAINLYNPSNDTGILDTIEAWAYSNIFDAKIGTFSGSGSTYDDRDYTSIGAIYTGAKRTITGLSIDVNTGDFLGAFFATGTIMRIASGYSGLYERTGDSFGSGSNSYSFLSGDAISIYGTGSTGGGVEETVSCSLGIISSRVKGVSKFKKALLGLKVSNSKSKYFYRSLLSNVGEKTTLAYNKIYSFISRLSLSSINNKSIGKYKNTLIGLKTSLSKNVQLNRIISPKLGLLTKKILGRYKSLIAKLGLTPSVAEEKSHDYSFEIGPPATDRSSTANNGITYLDGNFTSPKKGTITTVEVWAASNILYTWYVGTFYYGGVSTYYVNRDFAYLGSVTAGSKQTFTGLSIDVRVSDVLGHYNGSGNIEQDATGTTLYYAGNAFGGSPFLFEFNSFLTISVHAIATSLISYTVSCSNGLYGIKSKGLYRLNQVRLGLLSAIDKSKIINKIINVLLGLKSSISFAQAYNIIYSAYMGLTSNLNKGLYKYINSILELITKSNRNYINLVISNISLSIQQFVNKLVNKYIDATIGIISKVTQGIGKVWSTTIELLSYINRNLHLSFTFDLLLSEISNTSRGFYEVINSKIGLNSRLARLFYKIKQISSNISYSIRINRIYYKLVSILSRLGLTSLVFRARSTFETLITKLGLLYNDISDIEIWLKIGLVSSTSKLIQYFRYITSNINLISIFSRSIFKTLRTNLGLLSIKLKEFYSLIVVKLGEIIEYSRRYSSIRQFYANLYIGNLLNRNIIISKVFTSLVSLATSVNKSSLFVRVKRSILELISYFEYELPRVKIIIVRMGLNTTFYRKFIHIGYYVLDIIRTAFVLLFNRNYKTLNISYSKKELSFRIYRSG